VAQAAKGVILSYSSAWSSRTISMSYWFCRFSQNCGVVLKNVLNARVRHLERLRQPVWGLAERFQNVLSDDIGGMDGRQAFGIHGVCLTQW
jgi:hypothetical protein